MRSVEDAEEHCKSTDEMKRYFVMLVLLRIAVSSNARCSFGEGNLFSNGGRFEDSFKKELNFSAFICFTMFCHH